MCDLRIDVDPVGRVRKGTQALGLLKPIRVWQRDSFRLELFESRRTDRSGNSGVAYRFIDTRFGEQPIFQRDDFFPGSLHGDDSDTTVVAVLSFLSLQPSEAKPDYFKDYTERQRAWAESHGQELARLHIEMGDALSDARSHGVLHALWIDRAADSSLETVYTVFDCMTGERWEERFSDVDRDQYGPTEEALADIRKQIEEAASERRGEALVAALLTCPGCNGVTDDQCWTCMGRGTVAAREVVS